jgi:predicted TIM-barrel fold metal-dependent hydrolase
MKLSASMVAFLWLGFGLPACGSNDSESALAQQTEALEIRGLVVDAHIHLWDLPRFIPNPDAGDTLLEQIAPAYSGDPALPDELVTSTLHDGGGFPDQCCPSQASGYQNTWTTPDPASDWLIHDYLVADYEATPGGQRVDKVVLIESSLNPSRTVQGNQWMLDLVAASNKLYSYVGNIDPTADESTFDSWLAALGGNNLLVGIRVPNSIWDAGNNQLTARTITNIEKLVRIGITVLEAPDDAPTGMIVALATQWPRSKVVVDHDGGRSHNFLPDASWEARLTALSAKRNVYIKVSDITRWNEAEQGADFVTPYNSSTDVSKYAPALDVMYRKFGADRLLWASNWPVSDTAGRGGLKEGGTDTINIQLELVDEWLNNKPASAKKKILGVNSLKVYHPRCQTAGPKTGTAQSHALFGD